MKSIIIIIPYFGHFPDYFQLFLNSCRWNDTIDWAIITDVEEPYDYPDNVKLVKSTFAQVQTRIKQAFDFDAVIDSPYKLCDYRPAYAYLFPEIVAGYDYWGYGDTDLIYGDLRHFLTDELLIYNKLFKLGHFTLIANQDKHNTMFMESLHREKYYKKVFSSGDAFNFDEEFMDKVNINTIFRDQGCSIWEESYAADIYTKSSDFLLDLGDGCPEKRQDGLFVWNKGHLTRYTKDSNGNIASQEYMYIHLQKRPMKCRVSQTAVCYKMIPNAFEELEVDGADIVSHFDKIKKKNANMQYFRVRGRNLITKIKKRLQ